MNMCTLCKPACVPHYWYRAPRRVWRDQNILLRLRLDESSKYSVGQREYPRRYALGVCVSSQRARGIRSPAFVYIYSSGARGNIRGDVARADGIFGGICLLRQHIAEIPPTHIFGDVIAKRSTLRSHSGGLAEAGNWIGPRVERLTISHVDRDELIAEPRKSKTFGSAVCRDIKYAIFIEKSNVNTVKWELSHKIVKIAASSACLKVSELGPSRDWFVVDPRIAWRRCEWLLASQSLSVVIVSPSAVCMCVSIVRAVSILFSSSREDSRLMRYKIFNVKAHRREP